MNEITVTITDPIGLHARPASIMCQEAAKYKSKINLKTEKATANLKSIMNVMSLGVKTNTQVTIVADGEDAEQAIASIRKVMVENKIIEN